MLLSPSIPNTGDNKTSSIFTPIVFGDTWMALATPLAGHHYRVRRLDGQDLAATPFMLLAQDDDASVPMGAETLVIVGWQFAPGHPGFILLSDRANLTAGDVASGEELQDHSCTVLN